MSLPYKTFFQFIHVHTFTSLLQHFTLMLNQILQIYESKINDSKKKRVRICNNTLFASLASILIRQSYRHGHIKEW